MKILKLFFLLVVLNTTSHAQLMDITSKLASNPGKLNAFVHIPNNKWKANLPVVVVLHGCSQSANAIYKDAGWEKLSDSLNFIVLLPEQRMVNNSGRCFNWFQASNQTPDGDEIKSILGMLSYVQKTYETDSTQNFIYGVSAGAAMAVNCIFIAPTQFKGAAILAGSTYNTSGSYGETLKALVKTKNLSDDELSLSAGHVAQKAASFPKTLVLQGDEDKVVNPTNSSNLVRQIALTRKLVATDTLALNTKNFKNPIRSVTYSNAVTHEKLEYCLVHNWGHYLLIDPGTAPNQGGNKSALARDGDFWSTLYIVNFWFK